MIKMVNGKLEVEGIEPELLSELAYIVHKLVYAKDLNIPIEHVRHAVEIGIKSDEEVHAEAEQVIRKIKDNLRQKIAAMMDCKNCPSSSTCTEERKEKELDELVEDYVELRNRLIKSFIEHVSENKRSNEETEKSEVDDDIFKKMFGDIF